MCCHAQPLPIDALPSGYNTGVQRTAVFGAARAARRATHAVSAAVCGQRSYGTTRSQPAPPRPGSHAHATPPPPRPPPPPPLLRRQKPWPEHWAGQATGASWPHRTPPKPAWHSHLPATHAPWPVQPPGQSLRVARRTPPREPCVAGAGSVVAQAAAVASAVAGADEGHDNVQSWPCILRDTRRREAPPPRCSARGRRSCWGTRIERFPAVCAAIPGIAGADALLTGAVRPTAVLAAVALR